MLPLGGARYSIAEGIKAAVLSSTVGNAQLSAVQGVGSHGFVALPVPVGARFHSARSGKYRPFQARSLEDHCPNDDHGTKKQKGIEARSCWQLGFSFFPLIGERSRHSFSASKDHHGLFETMRRWRRMPMCQLLRTRVLLAMTATRLLVSSR